MRPTHSLNGLWTLHADPDDTGARMGWPKKPPVAGGIDVSVPGVLDASASKARGAHWFVRSFDALETFLGSPCELCFDGVADQAEVWLNGTSIGRHEGAHAPFRLAAGKALVDGANTIAVRVTGTSGGTDGLFPITGLWGGVRLESVPARRITDVFIQPDLRRKRLTVSVTLSAPGAVRAEIAGTAFSTEQPAGKFLLEFPEHEVWSPESPKVYTLRVSALDGADITDEVAIPFGMREVTVRDQRFYLNNHPVYLRGTVLDVEYPGALAAPADSELLRKELAAAKDAGFNLIRVQTRAPLPQTLDLCDELGLLVWVRLPMGDSGRDLMLHDRNHPAVVIWEIADGVALEEAAALDPSRVLLGGSPSGGASGQLLRPYHQTPEPCDALSLHLRAPVEADIESYCRHNGAPGALYLLREFGFGGVEDVPAALAGYGEGPASTDAQALFAMAARIEEGFAARGLDRIFGDLPAFARAAQEVQIDAARLQIDALRGNDKLAGYCYGRLADAGLPGGGGMVDRWRRPKPLAQALKQTQLAVRPLIVMPKTTLVPREEANVSIVLANDARIEGLGEISLQIVGPTNQVLWKKKRGIKIAKNRREVWSGRIGASGSVGPHKFVVRILHNMQVIAQNSIDIHVLPPAEPCHVTVSVVDPGGSWRKRCLTLSKQGKNDALVHVVPPLANTIRAYPQKELSRALGLAYEGAVTVFFGPPDDWNDLARQFGEDISATPRAARGGRNGVFHYAKLHPVFEGLPSRGLLRQVYRNIVPSKAFIEASDEDVCGFFDAAAASAGTPCWGDDILARRFGSGRLVFTHMRILENIGEDPAADRLYVNLLNHFARRSVPAEEAIKGGASTEQWLSREQENVRRWKVLGMFPNWLGKSHDAVLPPEENIDLTAAYAGWYRLIRWTDWHTQNQHGHRFGFNEACSAVLDGPSTPDYGTAYAYAEFAAERRQDVNLLLGTLNPLKVWFNGRLVFASSDAAQAGALDRHAVESAVRQGRNTVLVKVSKGPGPCEASFDLASRTREPLRLNWWK